MVIWRHPRSAVLYTDEPSRARLWYGEDYLDHAIVCDVKFNLGDWYRWMQVVR